MGTQWVPMILGAGLATHCQHSPTDAVPVLPLVPACVRVKVPHFASTVDWAP